MTAPKPRTPAPELEVETVGGGTWKLADQRPDAFEDAREVLHDLVGLVLDGLGDGFGVVRQVARDLAGEEQPAVDLDGVAIGRHRLRRARNHVEDRRGHVLSSVLIVFALTGFRRRA